MTCLTRRETMSMLVGSLFAARVVGADSAPDERAAAMLKGNIFASVQWAVSADDPRVGAGADLASLRDRISTFFGAAEGRYLTDQLIYQDAAGPGWDTNSRPIHDQFVAIFKGAPELDATLANGVRMVARFHSVYKAAVFLDGSGNIQNAALTFDFCPPNGVTQVIEGRKTQTNCLWPFSGVIFSKSSKPDPLVARAWERYLQSLPLEMERASAGRMSPDGKVNIRIFARQV